jgi:hypothetical protein
VGTRAGKVEKAATGRSPDPGCHLHQTGAGRGRGDRRPYFRPVNLPGRLSVVDGSLYCKSHADRSVEDLLTLLSWLRECTSGEFVQRAFSCQCDLVFCWWWRMSRLPGEGGVLACCVTFHGASRHVALHGCRMFDCCVQAAGMHHWA